MFERFHREARQAVVLAQDNARRLRHHYIGTEHILLGLLGQPESLSARVLDRHGLDHARAVEAVTALVPAQTDSDLDVEALESIGIDLSAIREKVEAAFGPGALDRPPRLDRRGRPFGGRHIPFTPRAKKSLELSLREAINLKHRDIADGHLLLGILREGEGLGARVIADAGIDLAALRREIVAALA
ncbi:Clp protease N-terminal domain-containing protein [Planomonospora venezuelensis]|uniref:ATP-dependent Clp protease ATP-binding subunit ClpA n=1 Tax=Planomonospora venezuelensis TaxID=1999 RepID=A0A841D393_PLAVE|nr:Clp protease N-terminal domain-containing protein [Planomonospora venezuelensis]MBB5962858.1 ATP-dependent Clp protease ATP-binding subunit ClpA [Planomonospora venezuelensis]GIM99345.1 Clp protease [Planomonospora venezuelensis]